MIITPLDKPPDKVIKCAHCGRPMTVSHHFIQVLNHWMHASAHETCQQNYELRRTQAKHSTERAIPEHFQQPFSPTKFGNPEVLEAAQTFQPDSRLKSLILVGVPSRGKSRLMWAIITQFFDILQLNTGAKHWPQYYEFCDLISEVDKTKFNQLKASKYCFIDNLGVTESYGRERAGLQAVIRAKIQRNDTWLFMTVDSLSFDPGLQDFWKGRATVVYIDK